MNAIAQGFLTVTLAVIVLGGCPPTPPPGPKPPKPGHVETTCADVCAKWAELECVHAEPTPAGQTCVQVCEISSHWDLACMGAVAECAQIDACPRQ